MRRVCEEAFDNSLRYLARGKLSKARVRMEAILEEEGLSEEEASHLARSTMRLWAKWLMKGRRVQ